jgi:hypothetical protein
VLVLGFNNLSFGLLDLLMFFADRTPQSINLIHQVLRLIGHLLIDLLAADEGLSVGACHHFLLLHLDFLFC